MLIRGFRKGNQRGTHGGVWREYTKTTQGSVKAVVRGKFIAMSMYTKNIDRAQMKI
jgi:hypothetical protein